MRILICQLRNHGDVIRTFTLIESIKANYPGSFVGFTCFDDMVETCKLCGEIDVVIPQPRFKPVTDTQGGTRILDCGLLEEAAEKARSYNFDLYLDLHGVFQSAVFGVVSGICRRLGRSRETAKDGATLFYTDVQDVRSKEVNRMERHFVVAQKLLPKAVPSPRCFKGGESVSIFPGSSKRGILKRWGIDNYLKLADSLRKGRKVRFVLGREELDLASYIRSRLDAEVVVCDDWLKVKEAILDSSLVIGNDGAFVHLSIWQNVPTIVICGPLSPVVNGVWKYGVGRTLSATPKCHCTNVWAGECEHQHQCMTAISVEAVESAAKELLDDDNP